MALFYSDVDFPGPIVARLRSFGHDVLKAHEDRRANQRIPDPELLQRATELGRIVLTMNRDDFHKLHLQMPGHAGIITCTYDPDLDALSSRIHNAVADAAEFSGRLVRIVRPSKS